MPGADGFFYVNLKWLRALKAVGQLPPVPHDPDYERFLQDTGFQFERDLDEAARIDGSVCFAPLGPAVVPDV